MNLDTTVKEDGAKNSDEEKANHKTENDKYLFTGDYDEAQKYK